MQQHSAILIIPAALKPQADAVGQAMDWGEISYTIKLTDDPETGEVTHYASRADVSGQFVRWIKGVDPLSDPAAQPVIDALIADFSPDPTYEGDEPPPVLWGREHLDAVLLDQGLQLVPEVEI